MCARATTYGAQRLCARNRAGCSTAPSAPRSPSPPCFSHRLPLLPFLRFRHQPSTIVTLLRCTSLLSSSPLQSFTVTVSVLSSSSPLPTANATELLSPFSLSIAVIPTPSPSSPALPPIESHPRPSFFLHEPRRRRLPPSTPSLTVDLLRLRRRTPPASPTSSASLSLSLLHLFGHRSHPSMGSSDVTRIRRLSIFLLSVVECPRPRRRSPLFPQPSPPLLSLSSIECRRPPPSSSACCGSRALPSLPTSTVVADRRC